MALRVIMKGRANSVEEAKRFISNNHGLEPRYIREDKEQNGKIWLSNQLGDPIGFYEPATKTVKMVDKKTNDAPYFDPMYKDTRRAVVREAEKYLSSKGLNNSTGRYDKAIFGVRSLLEKTLLQPGTDKFNDAVHREVDRLLKKYNLTTDAYFKPGELDKFSYSQLIKLKDKTDKELKEISKKYFKASRNNSSDQSALGIRMAGIEKSSFELDNEINKRKKEGRTNDREPLVVLAEKNGYGLAINEANKLVLKFPGESYSNPHMYLGEYEGPYGSNYKKALDLFEKFAKIGKTKDAANGSVDDYLKQMNGKTQAEVEKILRQAKGNPNADEAYRRWKKTVKDSEMEKVYSYSIKIGGDLKRVRVKADNSTEALEKVKKEAIKFKGERVKTKWDNNKLSTRDQD